ncbi:hypothetical protein E2C01_066900 [Portunus trituberculatus]|uniref:Uncharacterized protein n=1 Tax=Portunus trituberculatus TaxID=210409 RepID=A0A5B7HV46_PORTR|nr:hypothetical protein [Portunus trituberculatus]
MRNEYCRPSPSPSSSA